MEQRKTRRFSLELPVAITRSGSERVSQNAVTRNIGSGGVLFTCASQPDIGDLIEYVITLNGAEHPHVSLRCVGKVLRAHRLLPESTNGHGSFAVAVTLERYEFVRAAH